MIRARVHRFRDLVGVSFDVSVHEVRQKPIPTVYLTRRQAASLAHALRLAADDIAACPFVDSQFGTLEIDGVDQ